MASRNDRPWNYEGDIGPSHWAEKYPAANGKGQSPIDINTKTAIYEPKLIANPLQMRYSTECFLDIINNGYTFNVSGAPASSSSLNGGPLTQNHQFLQFHMHWGQHDNVGSEHLIDGRSFAAELHFVHWNTELYSDPMAALVSDQHNGLAVLGVFVHVGHHNEEFDKLIKCLDEIHLRDKKTTLKDQIDPHKLMPANTSRYYTYDGSLTTPPCSESVKWIVFADHIEVSQHQLKKFLELQNHSHIEECGHNTNIGHNFRPVCPVNERLVYKSFE